MARRRLTANTPSVIDSSQTQTSPSSARTRVLSRTTPKQLNHRRPSQRQPENHPSPP
nr:hypothetical protein [uncultured Kingella sp.]